MSAAGTPAARAAGLRKSRLPRGGVPPPTRPAADAPTVARLRPQSPHRPAPPPSPPPSSTLRSLSRAPQGQPPPRTWTSDLSRLEHTGHGAPHPDRRGARRPASASIGARRKRTGRVTGITKRGAGTGSGGTRRGSGAELARNRAQPGPSRGHASPHTGRQVPRGWPGGVQRPIRRSGTLSGMPERPETASAAFCAVLLNRRRETTPGLPRSRPPCPACYYVDMVP